MKGKGGQWLNTVTRHYYYGIQADQRPNTQACNHLILSTTAFKLTSDSFSFKFDCSVYMEWKLTTDGVPLISFTAFTRKGNWQLTAMLLNSFAAIRKIAFWPKGDTKSTCHCWLGLKFRTCQLTWNYFGFPSKIRRGTYRLYYKI